MDWSRGQTIGRGSSATVSLATFSGDVCAVKSAELCHSEMLQGEQRILSTLSSPHVVEYRGCDVTREDNKIMYNIFMECMPRGTLTVEIRRHGGRLEEPMIALYTRQMLQGLEYLHSNGVAHCDIKGSNVLISEEGAKVSDFGCAKWVSNSEKTQQVGSSIGGTPMYMAPEVARGEEQGYPCDIWAVGCTVIEMATGSSPWSNVSDPVSVLYRIAFSEESPEVPSFLGREAKDFLEKCLKRNPKERCTATQLLKHPFLEEHNGKESKKQILESNSSSPTSILDQGYWNSVVESDTSSSNLICTSFEHSPVERIRELALFSGKPCWTWNEEWTTVGEDNLEVGVDGDMVFMSETVSGSSGVQELVKSNVTGRTTGNHYYVDDYGCSKVSLVTSPLNFEEIIDGAVLHSSISLRRLCLSLSSI